MSTKHDCSHVVLPFVHLNGTSAEELVRVRSDAYDALNAALDALKQMAPNGRDYYQEPGGMEKAVEQHQGRQRVLYAMMLELEHEIAEIERVGR